MAMSFDDSVWPGPSPHFPSLAPEFSDQENHFFRCSDCGELFAIGRWVEDGNLIECDAPGCTGQFYASLPPVQAPSSRCRTCGGELVDWRTRPLDPRHDCGGDCAGCQRETERGICDEDWTLYDTARTIERAAEGTGGTVSFQPGTERGIVGKIRWPSGRHFTTEGPPERVLELLGRELDSKRSAPLGYCSRCGSEIVLFFYPRPGPAPGNMKVCVNDACPHSAAGLRRQLQVDLHREPDTVS